MQALPLPQPRLERVLAELAREFGAEIRHGKEVVGLNQDDATVTAEVRGPHGQDQVSARYLVGCDGAHCRVRDLAGSRPNALVGPGTHALEEHPR